MVRQRLDSGSAVAKGRLGAQRLDDDARGQRVTRLQGHRSPSGRILHRVLYASFPDGDYWTDENGASKSQPKWHWFGDEPVQDFKLVVRGNGRALAERPAPAASATSILSLRGDSHEQFAEAGFVLAEPTEIEIYAEGEARSDGEFDFGWIINADTRATVWRFTWRESQPAGGAAKNRLVKTSRTLPAGRYAASTRPMIPTIRPSGTLRLHTIPTGGA